MSEDGKAGSAPAGAASHGAIPGPGKGSPMSSFRLLLIGALVSALEFVAILSASALLRLAQHLRNQGAR